MRQEIRFQYYLRGIGFLNDYECVRNILLRAPVRLLPSSLRGMIYRALLRDRRTKSVAQG